MLEKWEPAVREEEEETWVGTPAAASVPSFGGSLNKDPSQVGKGGQGPGSMPSRKRTGLQVARESGRAGVNTRRSLGFPECSLACPQVPAPYYVGRGARPPQAQSLPWRCLVVPGALQARPEGFTAEGPAPASGGPLGALGPVSVAWVAWSLKYISAFKIFSL